MADNRRQTPRRLLAEHRIFWLALLFVNLDTIVTALFFQYEGNPLVLGMGLSTWLVVKIAATVAYVVIYQYVKGLWMTWYCNAGIAYLYGVTVFNNVGVVFVSIYG